MNPVETLNRISDGIVARTFRDAVALDRLKRFARPTYYVDLGGSYEAYVLTNLQLSSLPGSHLNAMAFGAYDLLRLHPSDKISLEVARCPGWCSDFCLVDIIAANPFHIIPSRLFVPYAATQRSDTVLQRTDMLPIFFRRVDGGVGVPVTVNGNYETIPDSPTRISATSLEVVLNVSG